MNDILVYADFVAKYLARDRPSELLGLYPAADYAPRTRGDRCTTGRQLTLLGATDGSIVSHHEIAGNERLSEL